MKKLFSLCSTDYWYIPFMLSYFNKVNRVISLVALLFSIPLAAYANDESAPLDFLEQQKINSHLIADIFMQNVDQGKISIFNHVLKRSELEQEHVAYIHNLKNESVSICIQMKITAKIAVPDFKNYYVDAVSIDVNPQGKIEQIRTHVMPLKDDVSKRSIGK